jgi:FkbM family methyltransferase
MPRVAHQKPDFISRACVRLYLVVHGQLHLGGAGWLLRRVARVWRGLQRYPFPVNGVGVAILDLRDDAAYGMINATLGEMENDAALMNAFRNFIRPGDVVWDVGANVGYIAQLLVLPPFQVGRLDAFEPSPPALITLQSLFAGLTRVHVHPIGLGSVNDALSMSIDPAGSVLGSMQRELPRGQRITVPVRRGDDYRREKQLPAPNVVKIDVEGFEPQVLDGLRATIAEARPLIIIEHIWLTEAEIKALIPDGYELVVLLNDGTVTPDLAKRAGGANAALIPREKRAVLDRFAAPLT